MTKYFNILETKDKVDLLEYIATKIKENPYIKIYIGTDSQNFGGSTHYATAVVLRYNHRGGNVLYKREKLPRIKDHFTRLWKEAEYSLEVAQWLNDISSIKVEAIELDYNSAKVTESSKLVSATSGWITSLGFKVKIKPDEMIAAKAADWVCRH